MRPVQEIRKRGHAGAQVRGEETKDGGSPRVVDAVLCVLSSISELHNTRPVFAGIRSVLAVGEPWKGETFPAKRDCR